MLSSDLLQPRTLAHTPIIEMSSDSVDSPTLGSSTRNSTTQAEHKEASDNVEHVQIDHDSPPSASRDAWLEDIQRDDTTTVYSYFSTWSTNYTMSNLIGPGRLLGNLYSKAGASLEERLGRLVDRAGIGGYAKAKAILGDDYVLFEMLESEDLSKREKACSILLRCARYGL